MYNNQLISIIAWLHQVISKNPPIRRLTRLTIFYLYFRCISHKSIDKIQNIDNDPGKHVQGKERFAG